MNIFRKILGILMIIVGCLIAFRNLLLVVKAMRGQLNIHSAHSIPYFIGCAQACLIIFSVAFALAYYGAKLLKKKPVKRSEAEIINQDLT